MKFLLFVVYSVQDELQIWDLWDIRVKIRKETNIEQMGSICIALLVDGFYLFQKTIFLDFLVIKEVFE